MKRCEHCRVDVLNPRQNCPLCAAPLSDKEGEAYEVYPPIPTIYKKHNLFFRLLIFASVVVCVVCVLVNVAFPQGGWWSLIVLAGVAYMWIAIVYGIRRIHRIGRSILYQMIATAAIAVLIDQLYGKYGWAIDYVVPTVCLSGMAAIAVIALISRLELEEYGVYLLVNAALGLVPLLFVLIGLADVRWPSYSCVAASALSLAGVFIFAGEEIRQELKKRLHI